MWHAAVIAIHAAAGVFAFAAGIVTLPRGRWFDVYLWSLVAMTLFLLLAVGVDWGGTGPAGRVLFSAFAALAGFLVWRATRARRVRPVGSTAPSVGYVEHVGFTLVALFDAFAVIAVLDAGAPIWLVVGTGVLIAVAGHFVIEWAKRALTSGPSVPITRLGG